MPVVVLIVGSSSTPTVATHMRTRLFYGRGPRLVAAFFLAVVAVATVLAIIIRMGEGWIGRMSAP